MKEIASTKDDRELSKAVAVAVMGWIPCDEWCVEDGYRGIAKHCKHERCFPSPSVRASALDCPPHYASDIGSAMLVEDRIAELGLQNDYIAALWTNRDRSVNFWTRTNMESLWAAIHATPRQRCEAALAALSATKE